MLYYLFIVIFKIWKPTLLAYKYPTYPFPSFVLTSSHAQSATSHRVEGLSTQNGRRQLVLVGGGIFRTHLLTISEGSRIPVSNRYGRAEGGFPTRRPSRPAEYNCFEFTWPRTRLNRVRRSSNIVHAPQTAEDTEWLSRSSWQPKTPSSWVVGDSPRYLVRSAPTPLDEAQNARPRRTGKSLYLVCAVLNRTPSSIPHNSSSSRHDNSPLSIHSGIPWENWDAKGSSVDPITISPTTSETT